jgi:hypothetical protein
MHYINCLNRVETFEESKSILQSRGLLVKEYDNLYLVKYVKGKSDMKDPDVRKCRGIILEKNSNKLLCVPPQKSIDNDFYHNLFSDGNVSENVTFEEFIDGTMINLFKYEGEVYISTRSCLGANCRWNSTNTFKILFNECIDFSKFDNIDEGYSYSFVIQHPDNTIVKKYVEPTIKLCFVSSISSDNTVNVLNQNSMQELITKYELNIGLPKTYSLNNMEAVYKEIDSMNDTEQGIIIKTYNSDSDCDLRSKVRNINYNKIRFLKGNTNNKQYLYFELRKNQKIVEYLEYFPEDKEFFDNCRFKLYNFTNNLFNYYRNLKVNKSIRFLEIDYEYRPLLNELHEMYMQDNKITTKQKVIQYLHNLPTPRILFILNYKNRKNTISNTNAEATEVAEVAEAAEADSKTDSSLTSNNPSYVSYANMAKTN